MKYSSRHGFTVLEVLIVIAIGGILAAVAIYSLGLTRASNRDSKRISDVSVIRASITQYWLQKASYPQIEPVDIGRPGSHAEVLSSVGFVGRDDQPVPPIFLDQIPIGPTSNEYYRYHGSNEGYSLRFTTERQTAYGQPGTWFAHTDGVDKDDVER